MYPTPTPLSSRVAAVLLLLLGSAPAFAAGRLLVANKGEQTLGIIDPEAGQMVATIAEDGLTGHEVAASRDGRLAFVPIYGSGGVGTPGTDGTLMRVMDLTTQKIVGTVDFGKGVRPHCPVVGPRDGLVYVTTELDNTVSIIDPATCRIVGTVPTGQVESHMLAITSDGKRGYTANVRPGTVSVLDLENRTLLKVLPVATHVQRIAVSPDDRWVFTSDQAKPRIAMISTATNEIAGWIDLPAQSYSAAMTSDGRWLIAVLSRQDQAAVVDLATRQVVHVIDLPKAPQEVILPAGHPHAYVSCAGAAQVAAIDVQTWTVAKVIPAGRTADGLAWAP